MKKKYTWIRQITRVLMTLMLTIAVSVPVMAEPKAVDVDTQLSNMYTVTVAERISGTSYRESIPGCE